MIEPVDAGQEWVGTLASKLEAGMPATWLRTVDTGSGEVQHSLELKAEEVGLSWTADESSHVITERFGWPVTLVVFGAGDDALPLVQQAADCAFRVVVVDHRPAYCTQDRFPQASQCILASTAAELKLPLEGSCCVIQTHHYDRDRQWLEAVVGKQPAYIGLLGPEARCRDLIEACAVPEGVDVFGPVGLDLGAEGSEQIALSILAEILAVLGNRRPGHLRDREGRIHSGS